MHRFPTAAIFVLVALILGVDTAQAKPLSAANRAYVDQVVNEEMEAGRLPGFSVEISGPKGNYAQTYGVSSLATKKPMSLDDHVRIASITKTFTATAALRQIERGNLAFSDKLSKYIAGVPNGNRITIKQLLGMRSGLYDYTRDARWAKEFEENPLMRFDYKGVVTILRRHKPEFAPGAKTEYADTNYYLLGTILEKVTGEGMSKLVTDEVIKPLGLKHTTYPTAAKMPSPFANGYYAGPEGKGQIVDSTPLNPDTSGAAGAMVSTLGDLHKYAKQLAGGALLSPAMQRVRLKFGLFSKTPQITAGYGLGIGSFGQWLGHNGAIFGFSTVAMYDPKNGTDITAAANLSSNFSTPTLETFFKIAERLYPGSLKN